MGYMNIKNLYADTTILLFRECYALEKIHGTSAHVFWDFEKKEFTFFSGGEKHDRFVSLFDIEVMKEKAISLLSNSVTFYGEAYGGKQQGMSGTYGPDLKFIVFDVKIGEHWLDVPKAESLALSMGFEFVDYEKVSTDLESLDAIRDKPSRQAKRNGIAEDKNAEGVVLRPLIEMTLNNGSRVICKHKRADFRETKEVIPVDPEQQKILADAQLVAEQWVVNMRLEHVLDKLGSPCDISATGKVVKAMIEDVQRESEGFVVWSPEVKKEIGKRAASLFKQRVLKVKNNG